jgi:ATP-dependent DNA ligase
MRKKPMLAYPVSDKPINYDDKVFMQPKLDGVRCVIQCDKTNVLDYPIPTGCAELNGVRYQVKAYSRTGKEWKNIDHILFNLKPWFALNPDVILDGELYNHDLKDDFEKIISLVRKTKPTEQDRLESADLVQFHCYDIIDETKTFEERMNFITQAVPRNHTIKHVTTTRVYKHEEALNIHHDANLANGYEGSILRTNDTYKCGRSWNLRKFKDFHDAEATLLAWVEGKGKRKGTVGKFIAVDADGNEFGMPVMDKFDYLQKNFRKMRNWVGKTATFTYFERTKANSYRHPLFKCIRDYE